MAHAGTHGGWVGDFNSLSSPAPALPAGPSPPLATRWGGSPPTAPRGPERHERRRAAAAQSVHTVGDSPPPGTRRLGAARACREGVAWCDVARQPSKPGNRSTTAAAITPIDSQIANSGALHPGEFGVCNCRGGGEELGLRYCMGAASAAVGVLASLRPGSVVQVVTRGPWRATASTTTRVARRLNNATLGGYRVV